MFELGYVTVSPNAAKLIQAYGGSSLMLLDQHKRGDYGECEPHDAERNNASLQNGGQILSIFRLGHLGVVWIVTNLVIAGMDNSVTRILLPEEY